MRVRRGPRQSRGRTKSWSQQEAEDLEWTACLQDQLQTAWWKTECRGVAYAILLRSCFILLAVLKDGVQVQWLGL